MTEISRDDDTFIDCSDLQALTADVASAYLSHNNLPVSEVATLISTIYRALSDVGAPIDTVKTDIKPAVPANKSVTDEYLICLEDGKKLKMLRRHLKTAYNMTPEQYREKWGLRHDYPMVAPNYTRQRSALAREIGLGRSRRGG